MSLRFIAKIGLLIILWILALIARPKGEEPKDEDAHFIGPIFIKPIFK